MQFVMGGAVATAPLPVSVFMSGDSRVVQKLNQLDDGRITALVNTSMGA